MASRPGGTSRWERRRIALALLLVVGLIAPLLALVAVAARDDGADSEASPPETVPPLGEDRVVRRPLRAADPDLGSFEIGLPDTWVDVPTDAAELDSFVADERSSGRPELAALVEQLRPALVDEAATEVAVVAAAPAGDGYLIVATTPARGSDITTVQATLRDELAAGGSEVTESDATVGAIDGRRLTQHGVDATGKSVEVFHDVVLAGSVVFVLTSTGSAPDGVARTVTFMDLPSSDGSAPVEVRAPLHPTYPDSEVMAEVPADWVVLPTHPDPLQEAIEAERDSGDPALVALLDRLAAGPLLGASDPERSLAPRLVAVDPYGRGYLLVTSVDIGATPPDDVMAALRAASPNLELSAAASAVAGLPGEVASQVSDTGIQTKTAVAVAGPILISVTASGERALGAASTVVLSDVPPVPEAPAATTPPTTRPPGDPGYEVALLLSADGTSMRFPFPAGWVSVPVDGAGFDAVVAQRRSIGDDAGAGRLEAIGPLLIFEIPELPFQLDLSGLPAPRWIGVAGDGSVAFGVQTFASDGRSVEEIADGMVSESVASGRDARRIAIDLGGTSAQRVTRAGTTVVQDVAVVGGTIVVLVHDGELPGSVVDGLRFG